MLKNYFKIAIRNLRKNKTYSFINILGLSIGIACTLFMMMWVVNELSWDKFQTNADTLFRVEQDQPNPKGMFHVNLTPFPMGPALKEEVPEIKNSARMVFPGTILMQTGGKSFYENKAVIVDPAYLEMFTFPLIKGNKATVLNSPTSIVLTENLAKKYFGNENPVGKILNADSQTSYMVTGVMKDFPANSSFRCDFLLSMSTYAVTKNDDWLNMSYITYIVLQKGTDPAIFQKKLKKIVYAHVGPQAESVLGISFSEFLKKGNTWNFYLQPLTSIYLYSQKEYGIDTNSEFAQQSTSNIDYVYIFSAVAVFILLLAIINFINLTTARSETRSKEVGIKKTLGSNKTKLIGQFLAESILVSLFSVLISIALIEITLPFFNQIAGKNLDLELLNKVYTIPGLLLFAVIIGIISGSYPAFYLSSFRPVHLFKSGYEKKIKKSTLRSSLVVLQFTISIALIISTIIIKDQLSFIQNKNLGFNKEQLYSIKNFGVPENKLQVIEQELLKNPEIISVTNSSIMFFHGVPGDRYSFNKRQVSNIISSQYLDVDYNFIKTFKIPLLQGRFFLKDFRSDTTSVVINEAMKKQCGVEDPVGKEIIQMGNHTRTYRIIGVIKNFNYQSLHEQIKPLVLFLSPVNQAASILTIRISQANIKNTIVYINKTWKKFTGGEEIYASFMNQDLDYLYKSEERAGTVAVLFSGLAIFIACLGLFGLASFITEQRKKEIGIRKVLGASALELVIMLSKEFAKWVLIANIIAWPAAYFVMNNWLKDFAYRINITPWVFIFSGLIALIIALLTVSTHAIKVSTANPVKSIRYE